jgi:hypothetical protein
MKLQRPLRASGTVLFAMTACVVTGAGTARADTIAPATFSTTLAVGGSVTINKTVTVAGAISSPIDIFFLVDTTGSMEPVLQNVSAGFSGIVSALSGVASNVAFGVGEYKDANAIDPFIYHEAVDLTTNTASVQSALSALEAIGGGDNPEANLFGLQHAGTDTSWRTDSLRFVVWVGDAPGHDPVAGVTEAGAIAALNAVNANILAASATSGPGLNAACSTGDCTALQATRIVNDVGGEFLGTFDPSAITTVITNALLAGIATYSSVGLAGLGVPAGVSVTLPPAIAGSFDRSVEHTFTFPVTFTGLTIGSYTFDIAAVLDGSSVIATEHDTITVVGATVPEPGSFGLVALALLAITLKRARRRAAQG